VDRAEEQRLRDLIRSELENREKLRSGIAEDIRHRRTEAGEADERRRIVDDEIRRYYESKGGYREWVNDDGDTEWLTVEEIAEREKQIPVDMEELEEGQRHVRNRVVLLSVLLFLGLVMIFFALREKTGSIQVISNEPGATILLNGVPTEYTTDFTLEGLQAGVHLISLNKFGYEADGLHSARVKVTPGEDQVVVLKLKRKATRSAANESLGQKEN
jgi:hypothetical protein